MQNTPTKVIVHHSAAVTPLPQFDAINQWHKERQFTLSQLGHYVGYHYVIEKDGTVIQARNEGEEGCHTIGQNKQSIGVCMVGNFDTETPTPEQEDALGKLLSMLIQKYKIQITDILPHRKFAEKSCYGSSLPDWWAAVVCIKEEIQRLTDKLAELSD
jgi:N-acetylmuramoyl-L-alanine amidase